MIKLQFTTDASHIEAWQIFHYYKQDKSRKWRAIAKWFLLVNAIILILLPFAFGFSSKSLFSSPMVWGIFTILFMILFDHFFKKSLKNYANKINNGEPTESLVNIDENGIYTEFSDTTIKKQWVDIKHVKTDSSLFFIYFTELQAFIIPKNAFDEVQLSEFHALLAEHNLSVA